MWPARQDKGSIQAMNAWIFSSADTTNANNLHGSVLVVHTRDPENAIPPALDLVNRMAHGWMQPMPVSG
jgi:hypothetical protein